MKLPGSINIGVQSLAKMPSGANAALAKGAMIAKAGAEIGGMITKMETDRDNEEVRQGTLAMSQAQAEMSNTLSRLSYGAEEVPQGIDIRRNDKNIVDGVEISAPRTNIPAFEVNAQWYQQEMTKTLNATAETITNKSNRARFIKDGEALIQLNTTKRIGMAEAEQREYNEKTLAVDIDNAVDNKQYDVALVMSDDIRSQGKRAKVKREIKALKQDELDSGYFTNINNMSNQSAKLARDGDSTGAQKAATQVGRDVDSLVESGAMTEVKGEQVKREINREVAEQEARKVFDDIILESGADAANTELEKMKGVTPEGWTPDEWDTYTNSQQADINRVVAKERAVKQAEDKEATKALSQYNDAISLGFKVSPAEKLRVKDLVSGTDKQVKFDRINRTAAFSVLDYKDRAKAMKAGETGELKSVANMSAMIHANNEINKQALEDGYSLGVKQGIIEAIPLDLSDPQSLALKADQAETLSEHYGVPVSPLTDGEADTLSSNIDSMTVAEKVQLATVLNEAPSVWGQISPKNQQTFSMAGATGDRVLMSTVFKGQDLLKNKLVSAVSANDYLPVSDDYLSNVYGVQDKAAILEAAKAHYAATVGNVDVFDIDGWETSLSSVTGGIGEINGNKVELPRGVDEDSFEDFIDEFSGAQVKELGGVLGFSDNQAAGVIQDGKIKSVGANKYIVMTNEHQALFKANGEPLIIEFTTESQAQQEATKFMKAKTIESSINKIRSF